MEKSSFSIEEAFDKLNVIIGKMEQDELSLAESMDLYKQGVGLLNQCRQALDQTEKELIVLQGENEYEKITGQDQSSE